MDPIESVLARLGPSRASSLVKELAVELKISSQAARQRLSRARAENVHRNYGLLPKREVFLYLRNQWESERYWTNLLRDLRSTGSIYACAIDGLSARGGIVPVDEFDIVSGAPLRLKKQLNSDWVASRLVQLGAMRVEEIESAGPCYVANSRIIDDYSDPNMRSFSTLRIVETLGLEGLREWIGKNSVGAYTKIALRGENFPAQVGSFKWDLTAPSYLSPVKRRVTTSSSSRTLPGFVVADAFVTQVLDVPHIQYFIRKTKVYEKTSNSGKLLPILMARSFSELALKEGRREGLMMVTPENLFGRRAASALQNLIDVLVDVTSVVEDDEGLCFLIDTLSEIDGRSGNMRGILFELIVTHIVQHALGAKDLAFRIPHTHRQSGQCSDLDILFKKNGNAVHVIECKGKHPGGTISADDVNEWLRKIPIMRDCVEARPDLNGFERVYEFWTSGRFTASALELLRHEKASRPRQPIDFKDGGAVCELASRSKLTAIVRALNEHFLNHPLARFAYDGTESWKNRTGLLAPTRKQLDSIASLQVVLRGYYEKLGLEDIIPLLSENADRAQASDLIKQLVDTLENVLPHLMNQLDDTDIDVDKKYSISSNSAPPHPSSALDDSEVPF